MLPTNLIVLFIFPVRIHSSAQLVGYGQALLALIALLALVVGSLLPSLFNISARISDGGVEIGLDLDEPVKSHKSKLYPSTVDLQAAGERDRIPSLISRRMREVRSEQRKAGLAARVMNWSGYLLTFTQVVVGGVLANAYIQRETSPKLIGFIGVMVLVASLIKQTYQFDAKAQSAELRRATLSALLIACEDELTIISAEAHSPDDEHARLLVVLQKLSAGLAGDAGILTGRLAEQHPKHHLEASK